MQEGRTSRAATDVRKERTFRSGPYLEKLFGEGGRVDAYLQRQICERIKQARKAAGFTQEDMANLLNVTTRAYQNYERDRVPFRSLTKIASLASVSEAWLLQGEPKQEILAQAELLRGVADGIVELERSSEHVLQQLDEALARLGTIEAALLPPGDARRTDP